MNSCGVQQNAFEDMRRNSTVSDRKDDVVCPQPQRVGVPDDTHLSRSLRWQVSHQVELSEAKARSELLDFILSRSGGGSDQVPTFFSGSPPSRVSNPLTKDSLFRDELLVVAPPPLPFTARATKPPPPSSPRNGGVGGGGCVRVATNFGNNPAVRVVGFNCLDRDRRSSVPTFA